VVNATPRLLYPQGKRPGNYCTGPQGRSGRVRKILSPSGFGPRTVQPVASSYTDWAVTAYSHHHYLHYNHLWVFAFSAKSLQVLQSLAVSSQFSTFSFFRSSMTSSCHRCLGLPTGLFPVGFQSDSFPWHLLAIVVLVFLLVWFP
jgi:hypothetical protein